MDARRSTRILGGLLIAALWTIAAVVAAMTTAEFGLRWQAHRQKAAAGNKSSVTSASRIVQLDAAYDPFTVQYLHPEYLFFFPLDPAKRVGLDNRRGSSDQGHV